MKIFISHSSVDAAFGNTLVNLLTGVGIRDNEVIFTSNVAYGIPLGKSIFDWLKNQIKEKPYVIYLLSPSYYSSVACLNEMGAAWIVENDHTIVFTPDFKINSPEFQNGALDPREIGFFINNEERLLSFIELLRNSFDISNNVVLINQKVKEFLKNISNIKPPEPTKVETKSIVSYAENSVVLTEAVVEIKPSTQSVVTIDTIEKETKKSGYYTRFLSDIYERKLSSEELLLLHYIIDTAKVKLGTGWQEDSEIRNIVEWEEIRGLNSTLSRSYSAVIRRFGLRKYTEVSAYTGSGNPKEVCLSEDIQDRLLDFPQELLTIIDESVKSNLKDMNPF